ncbi:MAG: ATP-binding protein [Kofleriaceae bacterium]
MVLRKISDEKVISRIRLENRWWETGRIDDHHDRFRRREYFASFASLVQEIRGSNLARAPILMGPRRVGKTVLLFHLVQSLIDAGTAPKTINYLSVEHPVFNGRGLDELVDLCKEATGVTEIAGGVFIFDEIQYLRDWELHLKALVDRYPTTTWIASGSAAAALRLKSNESGAGRFTDFLLPPLTFHEYASLLDRIDLVEFKDGKDSPSASKFATTKDLPALNELFIDYLNFGGYPEVALSDVMRADPGRYVRQDIIDKVLLRDLPSLYGIADIQELNSLFTALAYNTANEISLEKLSQRAGVAKNTVKRYLEYLEAAFLVKRVHRIDHNARRFQRATLFKVYLTNPSLRAALFAPVMSDDEDIGAMVETAIFSQWFHRTGAGDIHYARWKDGEVDIVHVNDAADPLWVCEVKWSDRIASRVEELEPVVRFCKTHDLREAIVTTRTERLDLEQDGIQLRLVPASIYCVTIGRNLVRTRLAREKKRKAAS